MVLVVIVIVVGVVLALFGYWFYVPSLEEPLLSASAKEETIQIGQLKRTYLSYLPKAIDSHAPVPLVLVFHGSGINGATIRRWTGYGFDRLADQYHFAVAYPDGVEKGWNDLSKIGAFAAKKQDVDDVAFIRQLITKYKQRHTIDVTRVYAFGYSNGGGMIFRIAAQERLLFTRVVTVGAALPVAGNRLYPFFSATPPLLMINGTGDRIIPYEGGKIWFFGQNRGTVISAQETAEEFANTYPDKEVSEKGLLSHKVTKAPTSVTHQVWTNNGKPIVELYSVMGGGHVVPQPWARFPRFMGVKTNDINAIMLAIDFFDLKKIK